MENMILTERIIWPFGDFGLVPEVWIEEMSQNHQDIDHNFLQVAANSLNRLIVIIPVIPATPVNPNNPLGLIGMKPDGGVIYLFLFSEYIGLYNKTIDS